MSPKPSGQANQLAKPTTLNLPVRQSHAEKLDMFGVEGLLELIADGNSQTEIARMLGVDRGALNNYVAQHSRVAEFTLAMMRSGESWLDRADEIINSADPETITGPQVALLKLKADGCYRRAGIRNARLRERAPLDDPADTPAPTTQAPQFVLVIHGAASVEGHTGGTTYEHKA